MTKRRAGLTLIAAALAATAPGAIDFTTATFSLALTRQEIEAVSGSNSGTANFWSAVFIPTDQPGELLLIQDPSAVGSGGGPGTGLLRIDLASRTGTVVATDAALNAVGDDTAPSADCDITSLARDPGSGTAYLIDREDVREIISVTTAGVAASLPGVAGAGIQLSGIVFDDGALYYFNDVDDAVKRYDLSAGAESVFVPKSAYIAASGGTQNGFAAGPVKHDGALLVFDEKDLMGSDQIMAVGLTNVEVEVHTPRSRLGADDPNLTSLAAVRDGTVIGWSASLLAFIVIPRQSGAPVHISRSVVASALGIAPAALTLSDESSLAVVRDDSSAVEVLFGISGTGDVGKITFSPRPSGARDWALLE